MSVLYFSCFPFSFFLCSGIYLASWGSRNSKSNNDKTCVSSMIHLASPLSPASNDNYFSLEICFVLLEFKKWGRTDTMFGNSDHYRVSLVSGSI